MARLKIPVHHAFYLYRSLVMWQKLCQNPPSDTVGSFACQRVDFLYSTLSDMVSKDKKIPTHSQLLGGLKKQTLSH